MRPYKIWSVKSFILGKTPNNDITAHIGYMPQKTALYKGLSVIQFLTLILFASTLPNNSNMSLKIRRD